MNKEMREYCVADLKATYELHQKLNQPPRTIRRITVVAITFAAAWLLFLVLDVLWRGFSDSYAGMIWFFGCIAITGHQPNFIG